MEKNAKRIQMLWTTNSTSMMYKDLIAVHINTEPVISPIILSDISELRTSFYSFIHIRLYFCSLYIDSLNFNWAVWFAPLFRRTANLKYWGFSFFHDDLISIKLSASVNTLSLKCISIDMRTYVLSFQLPFPMLSS